MSLVSRGRFEHSGRTPRSEGLLRTFGGADGFQNAFPPVMYQDFLVLTIGFIIDTIEIHTVTQNTYRHNGKGKHIRTGFQVTSERLVGIR
jgi:hypothetical protein